MREEKKKIEGKGESDREGGQKRKESELGRRRRKRWEEEDGDGRFSRLAREIGLGQLAIAVGSS